MSYLLIHGDARQIPLADASVQCVVTSPPYWGLRNYGVAAQIGIETDPWAYIEEIVACFREVRRVLKPDGVCWLNLGDTYATGAGRVGERPGGGAQGDKWVASGQPATQPNRLPIRGLKAKDLCMIPARVAIALQEDGWWLRSEAVWCKPNAMPESCKDRPTRNHEMVYLLTKSPRYFYDQEAVREPYQSSPRKRDAQKWVTGWAYGTGPHDPKVHVPRTKEMRKGTGHAKPHSGRTQAQGSHRHPKFYSHSGRNRRSVWTIATAPFQEAHFATFPPSLAEICVLAGSRKGDVVLDPFCGAGTTGLVARRHGRRYIGLDLNPMYLQISEKRIAREAWLHAAGSKAVAS